MKKLVLTLSLGLWGWQSAEACDCVPKTISDAFQRADVVFVGTVTKVATGEPAYLKTIVATFVVENSWKGNIPKYFEMRTNLRAVDCDYFTKENLRPGSKFLVYATQGHKDEATYQVQLCSRTNEVRNQPHFMNDAQLAAEMSELDNIRPRQTPKD